MNQALFERVKAKLLQHTPNNSNARAAWIQSAWGMNGPPGTQVAGYEADAETFATNLLAVAIRHGTLQNGQHASVALLAYLADNVGTDERDNIHHLIMDIQREYSPHETVKTHHVFLGYAREDTR